MTGYGDRTDALLARLGTDVTPAEYARLAQACLDHADLSIADQLAVARIVDAHLERTGGAS